jgi:ADP-glucose pyrophosphorylase
MINHRHTRGKVLDLNSEVCPNSFLDNSTVGEDSDVYLSNLKDSWTDNSEIVHSAVTRGDVRNSRLVMSVVDGSDVIDSAVYDGAVIDSKINRVTLRGGVIRNSTIDADCVVGNAILEGVTITEDMRIGTGYWTRAPRCFKFSNDVATDIVVTESTDGHAYIGCQRKPMRTWIKGKDRFGKVIGWDKETTDMIAARFEEWLAE